MYITRTRDLTLTTVAYWKMFFDGGAGNRGVEAAESSLFFGPIMKNSSRKLASHYRHLHHVCCYSQWPWQLLLAETSPLAS